MKAKLVGYKRFKSKKGNDLCVANVEVPFTPAENSRGSIGSDVQSVFLPDNKLDLLKEDDIGKNVDLVYSIVNGRAFLEDFIVSSK